MTRSWAGAGLAVRASVSEVQLDGVRKQYEGVARPVIPDLDLTIPAGKMAVLVGPSGCGKSTTLRMVAGLEEPTAGQISIGGRDVTELPPAERDIAMVFQSYALYPHMTVFENMAFGLRIAQAAGGGDPASASRRSPTASGSARTSSASPRRSRAGSGSASRSGARSCAQPKVFLFDEPLSNLDAKLRGDMRREIARIHARSRARRRCTSRTTRSRR